MKRLFLICSPLLVQIPSIFLLCRKVHILFTRSMSQRIYCSISLRYLITKLRDGFLAIRLIRADSISLLSDLKFDLYFSGVLLLWITALRNSVGNDSHENTFFIGYTSFSLISLYYKTKIKVCGYSTLLLAIFLQPYFTSSSIKSSMSSSSVIAKSAM